MQKITADGVSAAAKMMKAAGDLRLYNKKKRKNEKFESISSLLF